MAKTCESRDAIARLSARGMKNSAISAKLSVPLRTVQAIVKQFNEVGHINTKPGRGRKRTVNTRKMRGIIKKRINRNDGISVNKLAGDLKISRKSAQLIIKNELGLRSYRMLNGQVLTDQAKKNRKEICKNLRNFFKVRRLEDVLWSDEKVFPVEVVKNSQNHRQLISPSQKNTRKRKVATKALFPKSLMVWGGISATGKTPLIFIEKNVKINAKVYQDEILTKAVIPWKQAHANMIFQQDWAPAHGAKTTISFIETKIGDFLTKELYPANSPDLNPLDFSVWGHMEEQLRTRKVTSLKELRAELTKIWNALDVDYLRRTVLSVERRIAACIKADGGHFENFL